MIDAEVLAERTTAIERHLKRVADCLPARPEAASTGPADLRAFLTTLAARAPR